MYPVQGFSRYKDISFSTLLGEYFLVGDLCRSPCPLAPFPPRLCGTLSSVSSEYVLLRSCITPYCNISVLCTELCSAMSCSFTYIICFTWEEWIHGWTFPKWMNGCDSLLFFFSSSVHQYPIVSPSPCLSPLVFSSLFAILKSLIDIYGVQRSRILGYGVLKTPYSAPPLTLTFTEYSHNSVLRHIFLASVKGFLGGVCARHDLVVVVLPNLPKETKKKTATGRLAFSCGFSSFLG